MRWSIIALLAFLCAEAAIFRSGWYNRYVEPNSTTGYTEYNLRWLRDTPRTTLPEVAVVGDSRIAEGFSAPRADSETVNRLHFWNLGIPGTTPRAWYYFLRDADPGRHRFAAIVFALDQYSDVDLNDDLRDRTSDLNYSIGRLRLTDCWDFAMSMGKAEDRRTVLTGCIFKGLVFRRDLREFLANRPDRLKRSRATAEHGLEWIDAYPGNTSNLHGLTADFEQREIHFPPGLDQGHMDTVRNTAFPYIHPDTGASTRYRKLWLGRILDLYRNSPTRIVFLQLPRSPLPLPDRRVPPRFIQSVASRPRVSILPEDRFRDLEQPDLFADGLHLNSDGRGIFSARLADSIVQILESR